MEETRAVIDAIGLERPILWGHSDGAIIALLLGLTAPDRLAGVIVEATHYFKRKPGSRAFFESIIGNPRSLGASVAAALDRDHGDRWPLLIDLHSRAWLRIADEALSGDDDFYGGRLLELEIPALVIHGARDPRTEPGELAALRAALAAGTGLARSPETSSGCERRSRSTTNRFIVLSDGGHSPHSERATAGAVTRIARAFLEEVGFDSRE
jgi:pimeloyl-ACP methyl ester carboxylesterase